MRTDALSGLVICNLPHLRSPLRVASPGKPFLWEVPPFLPALLRQLQNRLEIAWAMNVVFTHVLPWSRPAVFVEGNFLMANQAHNVLPFFPTATTEDGGEHRTRRSFSSCRYSSQTHLGGPSPTFPLGPVFFFSSIFMVGSLCLFLLCFVAVSCRMSQLAPPADSLPPSLPDSSSSSQKSSLTVHTILSLLLSLCLQPAATDCSSYCKWQAAVLGHAISEFSNQKLQFPTLLGRKTVPLQQQRPATGAQRVRTV